MQGSDTPHIIAKELACRRGDRLLFKGVSFDLKAGEALHVTGANGTGKTTLIRTIAGLADPFAGSVSVQGNLGLLEERTGLDPELPLGRALAFWEGIDNSTEAADARETLGLTPLLDVPVRYLSTGQRKRAAFAMLLNHAVPVWLLDEPLSGLDTETIGRVTALISSHVEGGGVALIASHQPLDVPGLQTLALEDYAPQEQAAE